MEDCQKETAIEVYKILDQYANEKDIKFFAKVFCAECLNKGQCIKKD